MCREVVDFYDFSRLCVCLSIRLSHVTLFFFYKNQLYKNKEAQNCPKFKNMLRTIRGSKQENDPKSVNLGLIKGQIKNKLRTFEARAGGNFKNIEFRRKKSGSYKKV